MSGASLTRTAAAGLDSRAAGVQSGRLAVAVRVAAVGLGIFILAALVRLSWIDAYVTIDESRWVQRASDFAAYLGQERPRETFIIGHPGVTTMWTALLGMGPERARHFSFLEGRDDATRRTGYFEALVAARRPFALVGALGVAAVALLGWRLLGAGPGIVGGLLLAFEPFLAAHARVTHLDSGLTVYMSVAALAAVAHFVGGRSWPLLLLSGGAAGLALLTKAPSIYLFGFVPLVAGLSWFLGSRQVSALPRIGAELAAWGIVAALVGVLVWPALRVDPVGTLVQMAQFTERVGGGEHDNFFLGAPTDDPGPIFYPFALLIRLAPVTVVGLLLAAIVWRQAGTVQRRVLLALAIFALGFMAMMTIGPKKFDRYVLPIYPTLGLLAGFGLWSGARLVQRRWTARRLSPPGAQRLMQPSWALLGIAVAVQIATLLPVLKYPLAFYSPLVGGSALANRLILVGWGEGLNEAAIWIDRQPRLLGEPTVATSYHRVLQAQLTGSAVPLEHVRMADYVVPYVNTLQRGDEAAVLGPYLSGAPPLHTVTIAGIEYARIYRGPRAPLVAESATTFTDRVTLVRSAISPGTGEVRPGEELVVGLRWDRAGADGERVTVALLAPDGRAVVQSRLPVGADGPDERGQPGEIHRLTIPPRTPPGQYRLAIRVDDRSGQPLAPAATTGVPASDGWLTLRELPVGQAP